VIEPQKRRVGKKVDGVLVKRWLYADGLALAAEIDADGALTRIVAGSYLVKGGTTYRLIRDHVGSVRLVVHTGTGAVVQRLEYDEYGRVLADSNPGFQPLGFAGGIYDPDTRLVRFGVRDYDPETGRWTAKDPVLFGGGTTNLYEYVGNDPINTVDPLGLANVGDVVFFNWHGSDFPNHMAVITGVDSEGNPTTAFGAWGDTMTFHEADLNSYNGGVTNNIIGYGNMKGLTDADDLARYIDNWDNAPVAPGWDGSQGDVCIDGLTAPDGYGGSKLRKAMKKDFNKNKQKYKDFGAGKPNPQQPAFYRRNAWLNQFFRNTGRFYR
jgi:RHS repeat-associated protein